MPDSMSNQPAERRLPTAAADSVVMRSRDSEKLPVAGTVARVIQLMRYVAETSGDITVSGVAESLGLPPSTAHRLLQTLYSEGIVSRSPQGRTYRLGFEFFRLSQLVVDRISLIDIARPFMERAVEECNESCALALYRPVDHSMIFIHVLQSSHPLMYRVPINVPSPLYLGASGRAILAYLSAEDVEMIVEEAARSDNRDIPQRDPVWLRASIATIRERGYAVTHGEKLAGAVGIAAPIFGAPGRVVGSLVLTIPEVRFDPSAENDLGAMLVSAARDVSRSLGASTDSERRAGASGACGGHPS